MSEQPHAPESGASTTRTTTTRTTTRVSRDGRTISQKIVQFPRRSPVATILAVVVAIFLLLLLFFYVLPRLFNGQQTGSGESPIRPAVGTAAIGDVQSRAGDLGAGTVGSSGALVATPAAGPLPVPGGPGPDFAAFYQQRGGIPVLGLPISDQMVVNGRTVQWFERARLELWPEHAGTPYAVQLGRLGVEYTQARAFTGQAFFASRPDLRYFAETGHAVGEPFLSFWAQNGGLDVFGYPISEAVPENLSDGQVHTVQYFERARLEIHGNQVLVGLLGSALYSRDRNPPVIATPAIVTVPPPTAVPLP